MGRRRLGLFKTKTLIKRGLKFVAYDIETTPIVSGTPTPLYITVCGDGFEYEQALENTADLAQFFESHLLLAKFNRYKFVGWNSGRFDIYFVLDALSDLKGVEIFPMVGRGEVKAAIVKRGKSTFTLCDGRTMVGFDGGLDDFSQAFGGAEKDDIGLDVGTRFDPKLSSHRLYAKRDARILFAGLQSANETITQSLGGNLKATIGSFGIQYFQSKMPENKWVRTPPQKCRDAIHRSAYRGGFVWCDRQYWGQVWHYDINQAYGGAMRSCDLPCGTIARTTRFRENQRGIYLVSGKFTTPAHIPFFATSTDESGKAQRSNFYTHGFDRCWVCDTELSQLISEGFVFKVHDGWVWSDTFTFEDAINNLEQIRAAAKPDDPIHHIIKAIGNSSYGKFADRGADLEYCFSLSRPSGAGWFQYDPFEEHKKNLWCRHTKNERFYNALYQPQIACFVAAQVRNQLRAACIAEHENFLYCDTDSIILNRPSTSIDIHPSRYGSFKTVSAGREYIIIGRKVYADLESERVKSTAVHNVTIPEIKKWFDGEPPKKSMLARRAALQTVFGFDMFYNLERRGIDFANQQTIKLQNRKFYSIF